jgi:hypothetical protein
MFPFFVKSVKTPSAQASGQNIKVRKPAPANGKDKASHKPDIANFSHLLATLADHRLGGDFGPHNVESGHHVAFAAGSYVGAGKVAATGRDGLMVEDDKRREHRVHWREVTGHFAPEKSESGARKTKPSAK